MKIKCLIIILLFFFQNTLFGQDFQWVRQIRGISNDTSDFATGLAVDSNQNCYVVGNTESWLFDIDPTVTGTTIIDNSNINHTFRGTYILKTDGDGNYLWGHTFGTFKGNDVAHDVKIGTDGYIYVLLTIEEMNESLNIITSSIDIVKISPEGTILSTISIPQNYGYNNTVYVNSFDLDNQNNIFLSGYFVGTISLDTNITLNNGNGIGNYVMKLSNTGSFDWVKQFNIGDNSGNEIKVRPDGDVNYILNNGSGYYLFNINSMNGTIVWEKEFLIQSQKSFHVSSSSIVILGDKNYYETIDVDPSTNIHSISGNNSFVLFLNLDGSFLDAKTFLKPNSEFLEFTALTTDIDGNYYFGGQFSGIIDFNPSDGVTNINSGTYNNAFFLQLDSNRNYENVLKFGQEVPLVSSYNICQYVMITRMQIVNGSSFLIGNFNPWCDFDPSSTATASLNSINSSTYNSDGFIQRMTPCSSSMPIGESTQIFCSSDNPTISNLLPNSNSINWYDSVVSPAILNQNTLLIDGQTYYASRQSGNCPESDRLPVTVTIATSPSVPITSNQMFCENELATIANLIITGQNVKWYTSETTSNEILATTLLQNNTNYYATQTVNGCESARKVINVTVNSVGIPGVVSPQVFCKQDNATLNEVIVSGQNIKWYDAATAGTLLPNATLLVNGTTYYVSQTINGCESARIAVQVTVHETAAPTGVAVQTFCDSQVLTLADFVVSGTDLKFYDGNIGGNLLPVTTSLVDGVTYYASQTLNGCESFSRLALLPDIISGVPANGYAEMMCDDLDDGLKVVDLSDYNGNLIANTGTYTFKYYTNLTNAENETAGTHVTNFSNYILSTGLNTVYVRVMFANSCYAVVTLELTVVALPQLHMKDMYAVCENGFVTITADAGFDSYSWSTGATSQSIMVSQGGNYDVTVTKNTSGLVCSSTKNITVEVSERATITAVETVDWTSSENVITVYVDGSGVYEYSVDGVNFQSSNQFYGLPNGEYTVYVNDTKGCGVAKKDVYLLMYPKYFTPNGDTYNDFWGIQFYQNELNLVVKIFDRYGKFIKQLSANDPHWDGTYNGHNLPATDYWFTVIREDGTEYKGHFTLKR
ncbi:T9SS type B sorting domain-containing protein [Flavobacterium sp. SM2513]|uniref:T9SS type B sorting domain-containing protein n=1 Tax=Flavobacterium sp. SM2513 TaxID=3424766 RepID=UPI003D7F29F9